MGGNWAFAVVGVVDDDGAGGGDGVGERDVEVLRVGVVGGFVGEGAGLAVEGGFQAAH